MAIPLTTIDASAPLDKILDIIARDGGIIVSNSLSPELLNECMTAIEPHMSGRKLYDSKATHEELGDAFFPEGSQRVYVRLLEYLHSCSVFTNGMMLRLFWLACRSNSSRSCDRQCGRASWLGS